MRVLILHANKFKVGVVEESNRPYGIIPEKRNGNSEEMDECLVVFFCVENSDTEKQLKELHREIIKSAKEVDTKNLMIAPFVHLSKNIADPEKAKSFYEKLVKNLNNSDLLIKTSHFGFHKSLMLDIKGHPGSFRYREFY